MKRFEPFNYLALAILIASAAFQLSWGDDKVLESYHQALAGLSVAEPESIPKAVNAYKALLIQDKEQGDRDKAFQDFLTCYGKMLEAQKDVNPIAEVPFDVPVDGGFGMNQRKYQEVEARYNRNGLAITMDEGIWYLVDNPRYIKDSFEGYLSPAWNYYLDLQILESDHKFASDAAILIPWDDIRKRIIAWENFMTKYPDFPMTKDIQKHRNSYIEFYLRGMDNTSAFDYKSKRLKPEARKSIERFIAENGDSSAYPLVEGYYRMLKEHGFKAGCHVTRYLANRNVLPYPDSWYRNRTILQLPQGQDWLPSLEKRVKLLGEGKVEALGHGRYAIELPTEVKQENLKLVLKNRPDDKVSIRIPAKNGKWTESGLVFDDIESVSVDIDNEGHWGVKIEFIPESASRLARLTDKLAKEKAPLGVFRNETLLSASKVTVPVTLGDLFISGDFDYEGALALAAALDNSPLPDTVKVIETRTTPPEPPEEVKAGGCGY